MDQQEKQVTKIDDDKNGYIDDVHGWNFVKKTLTHGMRNM